jgi:hypothetical protein
LSKRWTGAGRTCRSGPTRCSLKANSATRRSRSWHRACHLVGAVRRRHVRRRRLLCLFLRKRETGGVPIGHLQAKAVFRLPRSPTSQVPPRPMSRRRGSPTTSQAVAPGARQRGALRERLNRFPRYVPESMQLLRRRSKDIDFSVGNSDSANLLCACFLGVDSDLACLQLLLLLKRQARTYMHAGPAQRAMEFTLRRLQLDMPSDCDFLVPRPGRNFWCPDNDDWQEGPDPSEVKSQKIKLRALPALRHIPLPRLALVPSLVMVMACLIHGV